MKRMSVQRIHYLTAFAFGFLFLILPLLASQDVDPFYLKLLRDGENFFLAKNYREAVQNLEIAAFGLFQQKELLGKAYIYLGLGYFYLQDKEKCELYLKNALALDGRGSFESFKIHESAKPDLDRLIKLFRLERGTETADAGDLAGKKASQPQNIQLPGKTKSPSQVTSVTSKDALQELEAQINKNPRRVEPYYDLASLHKKMGHLHSAKETLQLLIERNPAEIRGYLELGKIQYGERNSKEAKKNLETFLQLTRNIQAEEALVAEAKAYLALTFYLKNDTKKLQNLLSEAEDIFSAEKMKLLPLAAEDKEKLQSILKTYGQNK